MLKLDIKPGESVRIGDVAVITLEEKSGKVARLSIQAAKEIPIRREGPIAPAKMGIGPMPSEQNRREDPASL